MAVDNQFLDSILSGDLAGSLQPADSTGSRSYLKQSGLKDIVALSPEERAADRATNENPAVKNELLKEIGRAKDPAARAALEQELKRQGGDPSASLTADPVAQAIKPAATFQPPKMSAREDSTRFKDYALDNNPAFGGTAAKTDSNSFSVSKEIGAAIDSYQANLWAIPAAMGSEYALQAMLDNKAAAEKGWQDSGAPQSFDEMEFGKNFGQYFAHMALQSSPYMLEFMATGFGVGSAAKAALSNTAKGIAEKAAMEAAKLGATKAAAQKAGEAAAASYMGKVYTASGIAGSYPSAVGDVLSNQHEQAGKFDLPTAAALGVPYAALNAAGAEGMAVRAVARGLPKSAIAKEGVAGFAGRAALTGAEAGIMEGSTETGQEVMNQLGRMAVDPDAKIDDHRALEAYKESFIAGTLLGGVPGAVAGGFRKPEDAKLQPPAPVANSPLSSAVNTAQHVEKQRQQAAVDDHLEQILGMIAQRDDLTERIAGLQNMIDRADPSSEDGQRIRAMQSDMQMRRDSLVAQLDAAKAFYGGDQTANVGPTNDPLILGNEQMSRIYQVTQNLLNDPASLDPESRSGLLKGFSVMRNRTLPEATRIDAAISLIATMDDMAARRAAAASGRADEREWNAFASDEAARDGEAKLRAIDKSLANSGPKPLPENEVTTMRAQLLDRVLATNPENPNRTFDRALRLEGFRDSAFTDAEKARIAQFAAMRAAPASTDGSTLLPSLSHGRYQHLSEMLDSGWVAADRGRLVGPNGEVYNLKGAGEAQFVRNKLNQKAGNGSQSPRDGSQGGTDQGDFGVGGAGANGPVPQGGGNGSGQANAIPDTDAPAGAVSEAEATGAGSQPNDPLNQNPTGRLTPLDDPRIAKYAGDLRSMAPDAGYAERGGRNLRDYNDNFTSRTVWIPTAEWFLPGMLNSPQASVDAVERAIRGYPMKKKEKLHVQGMMDFLDRMNGVDDESHAEQLATLSDIAYEGESADAQNIIDTLGDVDLESNGAWDDEVESMRALGFTEEEINEITRRKQGAFGAIGEEAAGVPAGEAQGAIPEGDGNGNGQAEGQEGFSLNQQTNEEAAAQFAQQQAGESSDITKEQADKERDAVPFSMQMQSQPKPQGTQVGLFTADGRPSVAAKQPESVKRKIFRDNKETGVREVHEVDAQDVAISELPDHQFFVFKDEEKGAYSLTEASTGLRVGIGETAEAAIANFKAALEKVGVETFAQRVADSQKITVSDETKPADTQTVAQRSFIRTYKTKSGKIGARIEKVVGPTGKVFYNYTGEWGAGSGHALAQMDKIESMWRKEKRGYTVVEADAAPETTTAEDKLHTKDSEKKSPATLDEFIGAVDAGYRAHYDYSGADGSTVWIEKTEVSGQPAWVMKWIDDDHPGTTQTKGGAGLNVWDKLKALRAVEDKVKYRFTEWKPVAESAPSPVDTSMRDMGAKAFADGLPRVAPEGIKGADKVRWLTGYDTAKNGGRERHELPLDEQLAQAERDLETIMAGAEESGYVEDARVTDRINRQEKLIKEIKAEIAASQQKTDTAAEPAAQQATAITAENDIEKLANDFRTYPTQVLSAVINNGQASMLYKAAGVRSADAFSGLPIADQAEAYAKFVQDGGTKAKGLPADYNEWVRSQESDAESRRMQSERTIRQSNGKPFKTEAGAKQAIERFGLAETHEVNPVDGGFELQKLTPAAQLERRRKAEGKESYTEAQDAVMRQLGIEANYDGEYDLTEAQWADVERRVDARLRGGVATESYTQPEAAAPAYADDAELQDALSHLGDVLGDVFGAKLNITGKQYGASDLLPAMSKVIELLIKKGFKSFRESVGAATNAMRGNANTKGFVDQITPRQWKAAYNSVAEFHEGTDSEEDVAKYSAEQIAKIIALPEKIKEAEQATNHDATPGQKEDPTADGERLGDLLDYERFVLISADDISKLRKIDVERVLEQGAVKEFRQEFADWIKAKRPDLAQEVDAVLADIAPAMTYDQFKAEMQRLFSLANKYKPGEIGFNEYSAKMADLSDAHPEFSERLDEENDGAQMAGNPDKQQPPGVRINGAKEKAAAERLAQLLDKMDQVRIDRNTPEGSAKGIVRSVIEELRKERTAVSVVELLETASQRLVRQHAPFSEVIDQVVESLRSDVAPVNKGDIKQADVSLDKFGLTVRRSQTKNGTPTWEVSGNTRDHVAALRNAGGKWYGPKKVWSFYSEESPEGKILAAIGASPDASEIALSDIEVERKSDGPGRIKTYTQRADEALSEIDEKMSLGKQLLECLNS